MSQSIRWLPARNAPKHSSRQRLDQSHLQVSGALPVRPDPLTALAANRSSMSYDGDVSNITGGAFAMAHDSDSLMAKVMVELSKRGRWDTNGEFGMLNHLGAHPRTIFAVGSIPSLEHASCQAGAAQIVLRSPTPRCGGPCGDRRHHVGAKCLRPIACDRPGPRRAGNRRLELQFTNRDFATITRRRQRTETRCHMPSTVTRCTAASSVTWSPLGNLSGPPSPGARISFQHQETPPPSAVQSWSGRLTQDAPAFYNHPTLFDLVGAAVVHAGDREQIAKTVGIGKAVVVQNRYPLPVGNSFAESAFWFITLGNSHQERPLASALTSPKLIGNDMARRAGGPAGKPVERRARFRVLFERICHVKADVAK